MAHRRGERRDTPIKACETADKQTPTPPRPNQPRNPLQKASKPITTRKFKRRPGSANKQQVALADKDARRSAAEDHRSVQTANCANAAEHRHIPPIRQSDGEIIQIAGTASSTSTSVSAIRSRRAYVDSLRTSRKAFTALNDDARDANGPWQGVDRSDCRVGEQQRVPGRHQQMGATLTEGRSDSST